MARLPPVIVVAPDKFKGSLTSAKAARAIAEGWRSVYGRNGCSTILVPMADGGDGTIDVLVANGYRRITCTAMDAMGHDVDAAFALDGTTAIVEMAAASGLGRIRERDRDPSRASSAGTGQLIVAALDSGASTIVVGLGGSATNDGGSGLLRALGVRFYDENGNDLTPGGSALSRLSRIDVEGLDPRVAHTQFVAATDVIHGLTGPYGASIVFGPQKGATPEEVRMLDAALDRFADVTAALIGRDLRDEPGTGAAGGAGFALLAFLGAQVRRGAELIGELCGLPAALETATLCLTGEGSIDAQTLGGKTVLGVASLARLARVPTIAFGGRVTPAAELALRARGVTCVPIVDGPCTLDDARKESRELLKRAAIRTAALMRGAI
jgi:glycerate 2-kinase